jgi:hypothetical protein
MNIGEPLKVIYVPVPEREPIREPSKEPIREPIREPVKTPKEYLPTCPKCGRPIHEIEMENGIGLQCSKHGCFEINDNFEPIYAHIPFEAVWK